MKMHFLHKFFAAATFAAAVFSAPGAMAQTATLDSQVSGLQQAWAVIQYQTPDKEREDKFAALATQAHQVTAQFPQRAESHTWEGIALSSWASAKGGLGALSIVKQAKIEFETAIGIDPKALEGSATNSLGVLYYKVPGWPVAFGNNDKAEELLKQALAISPTSIDTNYFYADYLVSRKRYAEAMPYLQQALKAPPRPGRDVADAGRKADIQKLMAKVQAE